MNPYRIEAPALVSFSGGRTSALARDHGDLFGLSAHAESIDCACTD